MAGWALGPKPKVESPSPLVRPTLDGADISQHEGPDKAKVSLLADAAHLNVSLPSTLTLISRNE